MLVYQMISTLEKWSICNTYFKSEKYQEIEESILKCVTASNANFMRKSNLIGRAKHTNMLSELPTQP